MNPVLQQLQAEAQRRFGGLGNSSAGVGASAANNQSTANPIASQGVSTPQSPNTGNAAMPTAQNPNAGANQMLQRSQPNEAMFILKAFKSRLDKNPVNV